MYKSYFWKKKKNNYTGIHKLQLIKKKPEYSLWCTKSTAEKETICTHMCKSCCWKKKKKYAYWCTKIIPEKN